jgi:hypothetical protein
MGSDLVHRVLAHHVVLLCQLLTRLPIADELAGGRIFDRFARNSDHLRSVLLRELRFTDLLQICCALLWRERFVNDAGMPG